MPPCRNLEAHTLERDRAITLSLTSLGFQAKRITQGVARRARAEYVQRSGEPFHRRTRDLAVNRAVVLDFDPRQGHVVENLERQFLRTIEHPHQPPFERSTERLLLAILVAVVGERSLVDDSQAQETLGDFFGNHGRAVIGEEGARQPTLLDRLGDTPHWVHALVGIWRGEPSEDALKARILQAIRGDGGESA
jgi:hypothetical protein